jgi:hypothetical protein
MLHEAGHSMGLDEARPPFTAGQTVMNPTAGINDVGHFGPTSVQFCDDTSVRSESDYFINCLIDNPIPPPPICSIINCGPDSILPVEDPNYQLCCGPSPILIDVEGDGFDLTAASAGVDFDINVDGAVEHLSWTSPLSDDAFLAHHNRLRRVRTGSSRLQSLIKRRGAGMQMAGLVVATRSFRLCGFGRTPITTACPLQVSFTR